MGCRLKKSRMNSDARFFDRMGMRGLDCRPKPPPKGDP